MHLFQNVLCTAWLVCVIPVGCELRAETTVSVAEIVATWKQTVIPAVSVAYEQKRTRWMSRIFPGGLGPIGAMQASESKEPTTEVLQCAFYRGNGMRLKVGDLDLALFGDTETMLVDPSPANDRLYQATLHKATDAWITSNYETGVFLNWLEPLASSDCSRVANLRDGVVPLVSDSRGKRLVILKLHSSTQDLIEIGLSEEMDWRLVRLTHVAGGKMRSNLEMTYTKDGLSSELSGFTHASFNRDGQIDELVEATVSSVSYDCPDASLKLTVPPGSVVFDQLGENERNYFVRYDQSRSPDFSEEEFAATGYSHRKLMEAKSDGEIFDSPSNKQLSQAWYWFGIGGATLVVGLILAFRRQWAR